MSSCSKYLLLSLWTVYANRHPNQRFQLAKTDMDANGNMNVNSKEKKEKHCYEMLNWNWNSARTKKLNNNDNELEKSHEEAKQIENKCCS